MDEPRPVSIWAGIDVSKDRLDVHLRPSLIVLKATGGFETTVAAALAGAGLPIAVVNLRQIRDFARALGKLAKTDAIDAKVSRSSPRRSGRPRSPSHRKTPKGSPNSSREDARSSK